MIGSIIKVGGYDDDDDDDDGDDDDDDKIIYSGAGVRGFGGSAGA